jgi:hypothetical protein
MPSSSGFLSRLGELPGGEDGSTSKPRAPIQDKQAPRVARYSENPTGPLMYFLSRLRW